ncbi:MAG: FAD-dependent oxidoreductase [Proteobacteria bacterium]|nr:FAD-dependent oxidoreductase [Pseudomonadota bacterium]MBU4597199.1 FAD-dependent oxidoreductase [Pseudomonadota bacterium]
MWLKNRLAMAPMGLLGLVEDDGLLSQRAIDYYEERAKGGVGLIITSLFHATSKYDPFWVDDRYFPFPRLDTEMAVARVNRLVERVHDYDCKLCLQLTAGFGRVAGSKYIRSGPPIGPSPVKNYWLPNVTLRPLATEEVQDMVASFGKAAKLAQIAGVDAIELHGHEGYVIDQFMTALWNQRTDKYGGTSLRERMTFPLEIIDSINKATGGRLPIIFRVGIEHRIPGGRTREEGLELLTVLEEAGVAAVDVDAGCYDNWYWPHPPVYQPPACMLEMAELAKATVKNIPVMCVGKMNYPHLAEAALKEDKADYVIIGRGLLADPYWPQKTRQGREDEIAPCIGCHEGCLGRTRRASLSCAVNPACGDERALTLQPAKVRKKVVVVGGGPAGMEAARVARLRGHQVVLFEQGPSLGGLLIPASAPGFKSDLVLLRDYFKRQMELAGVEVALNTRADAQDILKLRPDVVFLATGAEAWRPPAPGVQSPEVKGAVDVFLDPGLAGQNCLIVGGGFVGCELAVHLAQLSRKVTVVEQLPEVLDNIRTVHPNREMLLAMLAQHQVTLVTGAELQEVNTTGAVVSVDGNEAQSLAADSVIMATGFIPHCELFGALWGRVAQVSRLGDCLKPGKILDAVWDGFGRARVI